MATCRGCGKVFSVLDMTDGLCKSCISPEAILYAEAQKERQQKEEAEQAIKLEALRVNKPKLLASIFITTETTVDLPIIKRMNVISSQCVYGMNIVKDIFGMFRDVFGGRVVSIENGLKDAHHQVIEDLKERAYLMGADAVIAVKVEHTYNNASGGSILSVFATGTAIKIKDATIPCYECEKPVLKSASACPNCGAPTGF
ncbi:MAG: hypothetical protein CJD30_11540 [Sulfuricurvum sp. PD_MW2]|jgi:uncharacterized protein YbjQ (UPF0145 family)|uniref:YbjQ family protein n=1 Tax=Sulfuricurvum sp. PD_MW2 TaxID=2027917 RepID=UPI000C064494|nr:heavy metal-binding domain-containing protein [Sulfuricurvum sp. PD_MW2]PHM16444.1 MAG: hypothetical protein CJD30_11540 [Sulfuricurvum sp. PD_MW2]